MNATLLFKRVVYSADVMMNIKQDSRVMKKELVSFQSIDKYFMDPFVFRPYHKKIQLL